MSKLKYFWQAFKCAFGWHDIVRTEVHFYDDFVMAPATRSTWKCSFCEHSTSFLTWEIKGSFEVQE